MGVAYALLALVAIALPLLLAWKLLGRPERRRKPPPGQKPPPHD